MWWEEISHPMVGREHESFQSKREMARVRKSWLEKYLIGIISISRMVKENECSKGNLRNNLENNQYPRYIRNSEAMNTKLAGMFLLRETAREIEDQRTDRVKMDFLIHLTRSICFMCCNLWLFLGLWSVINVISLYAWPVCMGGGGGFYINDWDYCNVHLTTASSL